MVLTMAVAAPAATAQPPAADSEEARAFWSFQPVKDAAAPTVKNDAWAKNDIDRFILSKLEAKQISPVRPADKLTLLRRATFDLIGLPPTSEEIEAFQADSTANAFEKVVDRLLASPRYGERWGRHWLDVVRYADTAGESADYPVPQAYRYRDYVIDAFNKDKPYDQFLREQIAGDLMPASNDVERREHIIATGYLAIARRFSVAPESAMHLTIEDTIDTMGRSMLGMTLGCARCHDHKFDPISSKDYYGLYGIFASTNYPYPGSETTQFQKDMVVLDTSPNTQEAMRTHRQKLAMVDAEIHELEHAKKSGNGEKPPKSSSELTAERQKLIEEAPKVDTAYAVTDGVPTDVPIQKRGEPGDRGETAPRGFLTILGGQKVPADCKASGRLELAGWITDPKNPLTARVMVNRIWQHHFGRGIVPTPSDFGNRGTPPTDPDLLDHLASQFIQSGWSIKAMHRAIMLSATFQLSSTTEGPKATQDAQVDPTNELHWRFERNRLEAEAIRDAMLAISGDLDLSPAGPHPFPPPKEWNFTQHHAFDAVYETNRRSVYLMQQRIKRNPYLGTFDGADPNSSTADRGASTTPLQALFMMNDRFVFARCESLATWMQSVAKDDAGRIAAAYPRTLGRPATVQEIEEGVEYLRQYREAVKSTDTTVRQQESAALASFTRVLFGSNEFVFID